MVELYESGQNLPKIGRNVSNKQRLERLTCLRDLAWNFQTERRRLSIHERGKKLPIFDMELFTSKYECGSACCLIGAAATHPWFLEQGLSISNGIIYVDRIAVGLSGSGPAFFGITKNAAFNLFTAGYGNTPQQKALEVEGLIRRYGGRP